MRLKTNNKTYPDIRFHPTADGCVITAREAIAPGETMTIETNGGEVLRTYTAADWLRCEHRGCVLTLSNTPEPVALAEPEPGELEILQAENKTLKAQVNALSEQQAFYEDCIAEMASVVYA